VPSSSPDAIPAVISLLGRIQPASILDVGTGFGKWGLLFREYTDIVNSERDPARYRRENWKVRIEGIEGFPGYITPVHHYVYDQVHLGQVREVLPRLGTYDLIFIGDVIEHLPKEIGRQLILETLAHAQRYLILTTPRFWYNQAAVCGNELEKHLSLWSAQDFKRIAPAEVVVTPGEVLIAIYARPGQKKIRPKINRPMSAAKFFWKSVRGKTGGPKVED
jgi:hypothetical protein